MKKISSALLVLAFMLAMICVAVADDAVTPAKLEGAKIVTADEVKKILGQKDVHVYDMRKALNFGKGHLQGAVSLPFKWTVENEDPSKRQGEFNMSQLPQDKNAKIVFHSDGPSGWKSYYAAKTAKEAGYKNVMWYREGFDDWSKKGYPLEH
ncbi:MAG: rhodanese-like domain-containing protein [Nitrospirae bacterium]|nr:rhodanese-like domain-containing protein [Nitrospirota bacterium]